MSQRVVLASSVAIRPNIWASVVSLRSCSQKACQRVSPFTALQRAMSQAVGSSARYSSTARGEPPSRVLQTSPWPLS